MKRRAKYFCCLIIAQLGLLTFFAQGAQVFYSEAEKGMIFRSNLDGTGVSPGDNDGFEILSSGYDLIGGVAIDPTPIPEPGAIGLLLAGLSILARRRERRGS